MNLFIKQNSIYAIMLIVVAIFAYMDWRYLDIEYLAITRGDEYMQYHSLLRMYSGILEANIEDLFRFDSYVYGFIWHLLNLAVVAPFHIIGWNEMAIFMPRFLNGIISVLCLLIIFKISRMFLNYFYSYVIVLLVAFMSGFYNSGFSGLKPDVFQALLLLVSAYFLIKDNFKFGKNFILGILFYALSVGAAKIQAIMFLPLIYLYIGVGFLKHPNVKNIIFCLKYGIISTLATIAIFIITNPYILHPRGFGAWLWLFLHNMWSNKTNHGQYTDVSLGEKIFGVIDFYYFEIIIFILLVAFCLYFIYLFFKTPFDVTNENITKDLASRKNIANLAVFFPIIGSSVISILYLFFFVNKAWAGYYISSIYLLTLAFVALFVMFPFKKLAIALLIFQVGGGIINSSYSQVFNKYYVDLTLPYLKSDDLLATLPPLIAKCNNPIMILTDNPSFEYHKLNLTSKNIFQLFGKLAKDYFILDEFMKKSNSKNPKYFSHANVIILRKDSMWFDKSKIRNPDDAFLKESLATIKELESLGFKKYESKYFYIYVNQKC